MQGELRYNKGTLGNAQWACRWWFPALPHKPGSADRYCEDAFGKNKSPLAVAQRPRGVVALDQKYLCNLMNPTFFLFKKPTPAWEEEGHIKPAVKKILVVFCSRKRTEASMGSRTTRLYFNKAIVEPIRRGRGGTSPGRLLLQVLTDRRKLGDIRKWEETGQSASQFHTLLVCQWIWGLWSLNQEIPKNKGWELELITQNEPFTKW